MKITESEHSSLSESAAALADLADQVTAVQLDLREAQLKLDRARHAHGKLFASVLKAHGAPAGHVIDFAAGEIRALTDAERAAQARPRG